MAFDRLLEDMKTEIELLKAGKVLVEKERDKLAAEVKRLRVAMRSIAKEAGIQIGQLLPGQKRQFASNCFNVIWQQARAALEETK